MCHSQGEGARDQDGDGIREVPDNTLEGLWTGLRNFLRQFRGVSTHDLRQYVAIFEWAHHLKSDGRIPPKASCGADVSPLGRHETDGKSRIFLAGTGIQGAGASDDRGNMAAGVNISGNSCTTSRARARQLPATFFDNGIAYMNSAISMADITDGSSNTILYGETLTGTWPDAASCCVRTDQTRTLNKPITVNPESSVVERRLGS